MTTGEETKRLSGAKKFAIFAGTLVVAGLAFANAVSHNGLAIPGADGFGASFYPADRAASAKGREFLVAQQELLRRSVGLSDAREPVTGIDAFELETAALAALAREPASALGPTVASFSASADSRAAPADRLIERAVAQSKRNRLALYWEMQRALLDSEFDLALEHLDTIMRSVSVPPPELLQQVSVLAQIPEGRSSLAALVARDPNWLISLFEVMLTTSPDASAVAELLLDNSDALKDTPRWRAFYTPLVGRLADAGEADLLRELYRRIPSTNIATLTEVALDPVRTASDISPVSWQTNDAAGVGADVLAAEDGDGYLLSVYAGSGRAGPAATKVVMPSNNRTVGFVPIVKTGPRGANAQVVASCLSGERPDSRSDNLFDNDGRTVTVRLPSDCSLVRIDVIVSASQFDDVELDISQISFG